MRSNGTWPSGWRRRTRPTPSGPSWPGATTTSASAVGDGEAGGGAGSRTRRHWPSGRSWPTPTPPSPSSRATWPVATTTSAICCRRRVSRRRRWRRTEKALAIRQKLADANPAVTQFQSDLAGSHNNIGWHAERRRGSRRRRWRRTEKALAIQQKLADANPAVTQFQRDLALSHCNIGGCCRRRGSRRRRWRRTEKALAIRQKLADANPAVTGFQSDLAWSHNIIGMLLTQTGKPAEALASYGRRCHPAEAGRRQPHCRHSVPERSGGEPHQHRRVLSGDGEAGRGAGGDEKALAIRQKLADANPLSPVPERPGEHSRDIGWKFAQAGKYGEAIEYYTREEAIRHKLAAAESTSPTTGIRSRTVRPTPPTCFARPGGGSRRGRRANELWHCVNRWSRNYPQVTYYRGGLAETYLRTGQVQCDAKDLAAAAASWKRAIALYDGLKFPSGSDSFLRACCHAGLSELGNEPGSGVSAEEGRAETTGP